MVLVYDENDICSPTWSKKGEEDVVIGCCLARDSRDETVGTPPRDERLASERGCPTAVGQFMPAMADMISYLLSSHHQPASF